MNPTALANKFIIWVLSIKLLSENPINLTTSATSSHAVSYIRHNKNAVFKRYVHANFQYMTGLGTFGSHGYRYIGPFFNKSAFPLIVHAADE